MRLTFRLLCLATLAYPLLSAHADAPAWVHEVVCPMVGPFSKTSGPPGKSLEQILLDFHPEIAEWSALPALTGNPLCPKGILGGLEYQEFPQSPDHDYKLWLDKYGAKWEPTEDCGVAVPSSGKIAGFKYGSDQNFNLWYMCHNSPRWHEFHRDSIARAAGDPACSLVRQDNIGGPSGVGWDNGGWCKWCLGGYKERLGKRFRPEQLRQLGIPDLAAFDPGKYLHGMLARKPEERLEDPLVREYTQFLLKSNLDAWKDEVQAAHKVRADMPICGNQGGGDTQAYTTVLLSDAGDLIFLENSRRRWPADGNSIYYALALAGGRHSKPAWIWDFGTEASMNSVDGSLLFIAECYANGATPYYEMNNLAYSTKKGYYAIPMGPQTYESLARTCKFAREHRDLVTRGYAADAQVALLYSVPTFAPLHNGALQMGPDNAAPHFMGFARALERNHIPYNVEVLGDEELWPDADLSDRLSKYHVLLCPNIDALSDAQAAALRSWVERGGSLVVSGEFGTRDERFAKRTRAAIADLPERPGAGRSVRLTDEPAKYLSAYAVQESRGASQRVMLNQTEIRDLVVSGWSRAEKVSGPKDSEYSIWVDAEYTDGTPLWAQTAVFSVGTHGWERSEYVIHPAKPLKSATVHALFRHHSGTVWFDDLFLGEVGSDRNLLLNPGFEQADTKQATGWDPFLGWQKLPGAYTPDTVQGHLGKVSIRCEVPAPTGESPEAAKLTSALRDALAGGGPQLETDAPPTVFVRPVRKGNTTVVHLLNLDYDDGQDKVNPTKPFHLAVPLPPGTSSLDGPVSLLTPDGETERAALPAQVKGGRVEVQVPGLRIWSCVSFAAR